MSGSIKKCPKCKREMIKKYYPTGCGNGCDVLYHECINEECGHFEVVNLKCKKCKSNSVHCHYIYPNIFWHDCQKCNHREEQKLPGEEQKAAKTSNADKQIKCPICKTVLQIKKI